MIELADMFLHNFLRFDWIIFLMAAVNGVMYFKTLDRTNRIYAHFNAQDRTVNLNEDTQEILKNHTEKEKTKLSANELLMHREKMNQYYALYSNLTTMFPLMGMLGTVVSLIPMVNSLGAETTGLFFSALTSTFWGIVAALVFRLSDASLSYKIDDNEKHMEYMFNPHKKE
ncbi:MAG: MotA/TolQ/ExbB proton channel family protein [Acetatifactor sp.]